MDELDHNLIVAWNEVREKLRGDPAARGRRYERGLRKALRRPPRAWCISLRAADTRIESSAFIEPDLVAARREHRLLMFGGLVSHLCKPVVIEWPGVIYDEAARRLGLDPRTMIDWIRKGWVDSRRERVPGRKGPMTRYVWTGAGGVDVGYGRGRGREWGTLWQNLWRRVPADFEQVIRRVPRLRPRSGARRGGEAIDAFRGWDWECPGRIAADGKELGCGRVCKKLVAPLPVWTIDRALGASAGAALVAESSPVRSRFACEKCWNVQHTPSDPDAAWNTLVSYLSGGLVYGREVPRPGWWKRRGDSGSEDGAARGA
ncbi:MAG: hypothetical protein AAF333_14150 [Planctomycetota bacterium]